ncbi:unnamed protein product [Cochlearia groenlandica]
MPFFKIWTLRTEYVERARKPRLSEHQGSRITGHREFCYQAPKNPDDFVTGQRKIPMILLPGNGKNRAPRMPERRERMVAEARLGSRARLL